MSDRSDFYVVLPSNTPSFTSHQNKNTDFQVKLNPQLELSGDWEVGLSNIYLPPANKVIKYEFYHVQEFITLPSEQTYDYSKCILTKERDENGLEFLKAKYSEGETEFYLSDPKNVDRFIKYQKFQRVFIEPQYKQDISRQIHNAFDFKYENYNLSEWSEDLKKFISLHTQFIEDSETKCKVTFQPIDITVKNPGEGKFTLASLIPLPDFDDPPTRLFMQRLGYDGVGDGQHLQSSKEFFEFDFIKLHNKLTPDRIDVLLNIIEDVQWGSKEKNLLLSVKRDHIDQQEDIEYKTVTYVPLNRTRIDIIRATLESPLGGPADVFDKCQLVLHFKKTNN